ncbi:dioxygenase [Niveispirillum fermenti]|uniref:dioxygenase family protein n=1 Tax=Niveispirillum fermenti TaxID=1233113 RepID=UPI003A8B2FFA
MIQFDEKQVTQGVLDRFAGTRDARLREVLGAATIHLHNFIREVRPTEKEWATAIQFLTDVGQWCDDIRQEYILLSDVLGVSMLVDALAHDHTETSTDSTLLGPFYVEGAVEFPQLANLAEGRAGTPLFSELTVRNSAGEPIANAEVDVWHSDAEGLYDVQHAEFGGKPSMRGKFHTDEQGRLRYWSIMPSAYPIPHDGPVGRLLKATGRSPWRPAHVHFKISAPGYASLVTQLYQTGGMYLDSDAVLGVKHSLVVDFPQHGPGAAPDGRQMDGNWYTLNFDFTLSRA